MTHNINLYDPSLRPKREWLTAGNAAAALATCTLVVALATAWVQHDLSRLKGPAQETSTALQAAQAEIVDLTQRMAKARPDARLQAELRLAQTALTQRQSALELLQAGGLGDERGHAETLAAFARQSIHGLWLTGVALEHQQVALRGRAMSPELIPTYVGRLNREAPLQGRAFRALHIERPQQAEAASAPARSAPYVEFSLVSEQGAEAPAGATAAGARR